MRLSRSALLFLTLGVSAGLLPAADSVPFDSSGNNLLNGVYNFRQVVFVPVDVLGNLGRAVSLYGTITFDGNGNYSLNASVLDCSVTFACGAGIQPFSKNGTYRISAGGLGYLSSPIFSTGGSVFGTVTQGIFIGSSTEDTVNDLFVAAPVGASLPANGDFHGNYWVAELSFPVGAGAPPPSPALVRDALFEISPDGAGNLGPITAIGYIGSRDSEVDQNINAATYAFASGIGTFNFGGTVTNSTLVAGSRTFYLSPDRKFFFGGSPDGFDITIGVAAPAPNAPPDLLNGLYYQAGLDEDLSQLGISNLESNYGSFKAQAGEIVGHQRLLNNYNPSLQYTAFDYTYSDTVVVNPDGTQDDFFGQHHIVGADGAIRIGIGTSVFPGINVSLRAPAFSGSGVFLDPTGIVNWASSAPYTVGVSVGEFVALSGTALADAGVDITNTAYPTTFDTTVGGVQVLVNDRLAPIYHVSENLIIVVVPFATSGSVASFQVLNHGVGSEVRTTFLDQTTPGVFTFNNGVGNAVAQHLDFSVVSPTNPAQPGEYILFYVGGFGNVDHAVGDGQAAPLSPLSRVTSPNAALVDGEQASVVFFGLTPTLIGDYALIVQVPSDASPGLAFLDVSGPDSYTSEAQFQIGGSSTSASTSASLAPSRAGRRHPAQRPSVRRPPLSPEGQAAPVRGSAAPDRMLQ
jgi:uncharacterized protein (TIGR03437 family)